MPGRSSLTPPITTTTYSGGLEYLCAASVTPDERVAEAVGLVEKRRGKDGRWPLQNPIRASCTSPWTRARESPAVGAPSASCGCCAGTSRLIDERCLRVLA